MQLEAMTSRLVFKGKYHIVRAPVDPKLAPRKCAQLLIINGVVDSGNSRAQIEDRRRALSIGTEAVVV